MALNFSVGLPAAVPDVAADDILRWAERADSTLITSLGVLDGVAYPNHDSLITLAAVTSVTRRVRLMTTVLVSPLRNTVLLAKQLATVDVLCSGRLTVGLGVGDRAQDFAAVGVSFADRGRRFDQQLQVMRAIWTQQSRPQIGPRPFQHAGPELLIGGYSARALERLARWGDGYIAGAGLDLVAAAELYSRGLDAWTAAERRGRPRFLAARYFGFGDSEVETGRENLVAYYQFMGADRAARMAASILTTEQAVQDYVSEAQQLGVNEIMFWPCSASLSQLDTLLGMLSIAN